MTRRKLIRAAIFVGVLLAVSFLLVPCGFPIAPAQLAFYIVAGWIKFLLRTAPEITVDWANVAVAAVILTVFVFGLHLLFRSLWRTGWRFKRSLAAAILLATMFVAGMATVGLTHQFVWLITSDEPTFGLPEAPYYAASDNNLHQIAIGATNYSDAHGRVPLGGIHDSQGRMLHGWAAPLLPYMEMQPLYEQIDLTKPWNRPPNEQWFKRHVPPLYNPYFRFDARENESGFPVADYSANALLVGGADGFRFAKVSDGVANTLLFGEVVENRKAWGDPTNWRDPRLGVNQSADGFGGPWTSRQGANFVMADGSTRFISEEIDPRVLAALATPEGKDGGVLKATEE